ncbi:ABC transporter substrate-binding protein [Aliifodinibius salicampi]|uniref:ABC transporter substrate-binding protein n=1 Tax=Fodinibius salicampi TaxID=1920655 RepID=A0ABT3PVT8_9BACT|nr:ABC transporter substrate-binding protein [Fodinibius salicampi]MCW9711965.1 ABC transporter substrate-binding protein [Fodinibius salicampi]
MRLFKNYNYQLLPFYSILILCLTISANGTLIAQDATFDEALDHYENEEYAQAANLFDKVHNTRGLLFAGKAYFGMKDFATAESRLLQLKENTDLTPLLVEADYTLSLIYFKQKNYSDALITLYDLSEQENHPEVASQSSYFYEDLLKFLTFEQRNEIMDQADNETILFDLTSSAMGRVEYNDAKVLFAKLRNNTRDIPSSELEELSSILERKTEYQQLSDKRSLEVPDNFTYNIGVALPAYSNDTDNYRVAQGLYLGYTLAVEEFNKEQNFNTRLTYQNTGIEVDSARQALETLSTIAGVDAVIGPLYSERAQSMAKVTDKYKVPVVAPLANASAIAEESEYIYQANPTFEVHGKNMAHFAFDELELNKVAIIAQQGSLGELSARAFRDEWEELGGEVPYYFIEDLAGRGHILSKYTRYFKEERDPTVESAVSAVYAPFTGNTSSALIDLLLGQLNTNESTVTVLGSQQWANTNVSSGKIGKRPVYFTESFYTNPNNSEINSFKAKFRRRFDRPANRFAMIGYDTTTFLLKALKEAVNPAKLQEALKKQPIHRGLITNIEFKDTNINQQLMIFRLTNEGSHPIN